MKKHLRTLIFGIAFVLIFCISNTQKVYAVEQLIFDEPVLNTPYAGQTEISGILTGYGILPSGDKVPVETYQNAAWITINGKQYSAAKYGNQMFNYTIDKIDADRFSFTFQLPENIVLEEGDEISGFVIPGTITNAQNYPQSSYKMSGVYITQPRIIPAVGADVTVQYLDETGMQIANSKTIPATAIGDGYDASTPDYKLTIDGYTLDNTQLPANAVGKFTDAVQTVTYVYKATPTNDFVNKQAQNVTVHYVDQEGNQIAESKVISGEIGEAYDATSTDYQLTINGYRLDQTQLPDNAAGILTEEPQTVIYVYQKNTAKAPLQTNKSDNSTPNLTTNNTTSTSDNQGKPQAVTNTKKLPSTGETRQTAPIYLGIILLMISAGLCFNQKNAYFIN
jgi:LPXTG-motif cell wall-anchored protein